MPNSWSKSDSFERLNIMMKMSGLDSVAYENAIGWTHIMTDICSVPRGESTETHIHQATWWWPVSTNTRHGFNNAQSVTSLLVSL